MTLQQVENQVLVAAKMDEITTPNLLKPQWQELQRELESQGIKFESTEVEIIRILKANRLLRGNQTPNFKLEKNPSITSSRKRLRSRNLRQASLLQITMKSMKVLCSPMPEIEFKKDL